MGIIIHCNVSTLLGNSPSQSNILSGQENLINHKLDKNQAT